MRKFVFVCCVLWSQVCWGQSFSFSAEHPPTLAAPLRVSVTGQRLSPVPTNGALGVLKQSQSRYDPAVFWSIGAGFAILTAVPLAGNIYALAAGKHQAEWGSVSLGVLGLLACIAAYTALSHGNFIGEPDLAIAMIPSVTLAAATVVLSIVNLKAKKTKP